MNRRTIAFLTLLALFSTVYSSAAFYLNSPRPAQPFVGWGIYSEFGLLSYFPGTNLSVAVNQTFNWHFEISNRIGSVQFVRVVYRVGNLTSAPPSRIMPADGLPHVGMAEKFVRNMEHVKLNFNWRIVTVSSGPVVYPVFEINGEKVVSSVGALSGLEFRFFFELWTFEAATRSFQYTSSGDASRKGSWLQIGFNVTA